MRSQAETRAHHGRHRPHQRRQGGGGRRLSRLLAARIPTMWSRQKYVRLGQQGALHPKNTMFVSEGLE